MYRHDNLQAFDGSPIEVEYDIGDKTASRALFIINGGVIVKEVLNPTSPLFFELDETETGRLKYYNIGKLILFDDKNRKLTLEGQLAFYADKEVYLES